MTEFMVSVARHGATTGMLAVQRLTMIPATPLNGLKVTTDLTAVQQQLRAVLPPTAILVGHSLENDLAVLKLYVVVVFC